MRAAAWVAAFAGAALMGWFLTDFSAAGWALYLLGCALLGGGLSVLIPPRRRGRGS